MGNNSSSQSRGMAERTERTPVRSRSGTSRIRQRISAWTPFRSPSPRRTATDRPPTRQRRTRSMILERPVSSPATNTRSATAARRMTQPPAVPSRPAPTTSRSMPTLSNVLPQPEENGEFVSPQPGEDQAAMLSRLLSVAAAATAASLVGNNHDALREARDVGATHENSDVVDGSFEGFLRALQGGRLADALRNGGNELGGAPTDDDTEASAASPLNFFRMFRFSNSVTIGGEDAGGRMVPIIIVGIRSVLPRGENNPGIAPFFDSLHPENMEHNHMEEEEWQWQGAESSPESTTTSPAETPTPHRHNSTEASTNTEPFGHGLPFSALMEAMVRRLRQIRGEEENATSTTTQPARPTASRRTSREADPTLHTRSWIIYVLGGSYPENHPILTTPSLFTDTPTYEDMLMLSNMIGPAKPPTATAEEVENAGETEDIDEHHSKLGERCLVCLSDYEVGDTCRHLKKCGHVFHRECIDEWLLTGRANCPLCRSSALAKEPSTVPSGSTGETGSPNETTDTLMTE